MKQFLKTMAIIAITLCLIFVGNVLNWSVFKRYPFEIGLVAYVILTLLWRPIYVLGDLPLKEAFKTHPARAVAQMAGLFGFLIIATLSALVRSGQQGS